MNDDTQNPGSTGQGGANPPQPPGGNPPPPPGAGAPPGGYQPPQGAYPPPPPGGSPQGYYPPPPPGQENYLRPRPPDDQLGIGSVSGFSTNLAIPPHPNTSFAKHGNGDEHTGELYFLKMLSGSISLTKNEKKKIIEAVPKLTQYQVDELIKILEEEIRKFAELDDRHQEKIKELQTKQTEDWQDLERGEKEVETKAKEEEDVAALRSKLMTGEEKKEAKKCPECHNDVPAGAKECLRCQAPII